MDGQSELENGNKEEEKGGDKSENYLPAPRNIFLTADFIKVKVERRKNPEHGTGDIDEDCAAEALAELGSLCVPGQVRVPQLRAAERKRTSLQRIRGHFSYYKKLRSENK